MSNFNKVIVTGGAGTCGDRIVSELLETGLAESVVSLDNDEGKLFAQRERLKGYEAFSCSMVDIRDDIALPLVFRGADLVVHCAAYKNVPMCEISPTSCVNVNIKGTENVIEAAINAKVKKVLFTSSDKAVNPTNIMGASKLVGERLVVAANLMDSDTIFAATRFGNVVGSTGSVLPIFVRQIRDGKPFTVTDPKMTRFMMSQTESARLVIESAERAVGGEIFITKMPVLNIGYFAEAVYEVCKDRGITSECFDPAIHVQVVGARTGEKEFEELMSSEERPRSKDAGEFFVVLPNFSDVYSKVGVENVYRGLSNPLQTYNSHEEISLSLSESKSLIEYFIDTDKLRLEEM